MGHTKTAPELSDRHSAILSNVDLKQQLEEVILHVWGHLTDQSSNLQEGASAECLPDHQIHASVDITGDLTARIDIITDPRFATHVTRYWLGDPSLDVENDLLDTAAELANLFGGNLKTKLGNHGATLKISCPTSQKINREDSEELFQPESVCFGACCAYGGLVVALTFE